MFKNSLVACFACCCISFASAGNPPFFPTDVVTNAKGELLMTDKGVKRVDVFSPDGKTLLRSFPMDEPPTGILVDGDKAYVTTFGTTGHLQILSLESGKGRGFHSDRFGSMPSDVRSGQEAYICM